MKWVLFLLLAVPLHAQAWKEIALDGLSAGAAIADVEVTQHCINAGTCREGNPLQPQSEIGRFAIDFSLVGIQAWAGHYLRKHGDRHWWVPGVMGVGVHGTGIGLTLGQQ